MLGRISQYLTIPARGERGLKAWLDSSNDVVNVRDRFVLRLDGWAFVDGVRLSQVRVLLNDDPIGYARLDAWRPEVQGLLPESRPPERCGFSEVFYLARPVISGINRIDLEVDLADGSTLSETFWFFAVLGPDYKAEYERSTAVAYRSFLASRSRLKFDAVDEPVASIVVPAYGREHLTFAALTSIKLHVDLPVEVIVIDNSPDENTRLMAERLENVRYVRNSVNRGFGPAVNRAAELARGRTLIMMNNDCALVDDGVGAAIRLLESDPTIGAVGGRIHLLDGTLQEAGSSIGDDGATEGVGRGLPIETPRFMHVREVDYASGVFLAVDAGLFQELSGFDDRFAPAYFEDTDLCTRIWKRGRRVVYDPSIAVLHFENASTTASERESLYLRNRETYRELHPELAQVAFDPARYDCRSAAVFRSEEPRPRALVLASDLPRREGGWNDRRLLEVVDWFLERRHRVTVCALRPADDASFDAGSIFDRSVEVATDIRPETLAEYLQGRGGPDAIVFFGDEFVERAYFRAAEPAARASIAIRDACCETAEVDAPADAAPVDEIRGEDEATSGRNATLQIPPAFEAIADFVDFEETAVVDAFGELSGSIARALGPAERVRHVAFASAEVDRSPENARWRYLGDELSDDETLEIAFDSARRGIPLILSDATRRRIGLDRSCCRSLDEFAHEADDAWWNDGERWERTRRRAYDALRAAFPKERLRQALNAAIPSS